MASIFFKHGPISLSKNKKYLEYEDGTPFFWLADTWWYGATSRVSLSVFRSLVKKRKKQGFTAVQIVIGIPPEINAKDAKKIGGNPFNDDLSLNRNYFEEADEKIKYLVESGIIPVIFGGWGHHIDILGIENVKKLWQEIVRRYARYPVVFCLAGEIDLESGKKKGSIFVIARRVSDVAISILRLLRFARNDKLEDRINKWSEVGDYISKIDPFKRPITAHVSRRITVRDLLGNKKWLSVNGIQSGHSKDSIPFMVGSIKKASLFGTPIINMEPWYEGILGNFGDLEQRYAFWVCVLSGAKGHSYGAHGIWQMSKIGENFMKHWGDSYWKRSLGFAGAEQLGLARKFLQKYEWWKLKSCFEKITPRWTEENVYLPVAAKIESRYFFIYVPRVRGIGEIRVKGLKRKAYYKTSFISPKSMRVIDSFKFKGKEFIIPISNNIIEDLLVVISLFTSEEPRSMPRHLGGGA